MAADVLSVIQDVLNQDKQQKRDHAKVMREVQKKLKDKEVSEEEGDKEEYTAFVNKTLKKYGVKSPAELSPEDKKRFYNELDAGWKADDEKPEPEDKEEEVDLKTRVKDRMKAEQEEDEKPYTDKQDSELEDDDEGDEEGDDDEGDEGDGDEPSEEQIDKIADLVVQKLKDKVDDEEEEEEEPMKVGGDEEEIDTKPQAETHEPRFMGTQLRRTMGEALKQVRKNSLAEQDEWVDAEAKKVQHKWKRMSTRDRIKWLDKMDDKAGRHNTSDADLADILDDYGLTKEGVNEDKGHDCDEVHPDQSHKEWSKNNKDENENDDPVGKNEEVKIGEIFGLSGKEKQAKADKTSADDAEARAAQQRRNKASDERIAQEKRDQAAAAARRKKQGYAQGGHAKEEVEIGESKALQIIMALDDAGIESKKVQGTEQVSVAKKDYKRAQKILRPEAGLRPLLKSEEVEIDEKKPEHACPMHVKRETKEGFEYGRNISHTISENIVDFINIIWLDSNELQEMVPMKNVKVISEAHHGLKSHREKFKATTKIAEAYARLPAMDKEKYQKRDGLEGPIMTASGKVLYFDPQYTGEDGRRGTYYDPDSDFYIDQKSFKAYDDTSKLKFYKSPFDDPDSKEYKRLQKERERFEKSLLKGATKRSKKDRLKLESTGLRFARKFYQKGEQDDRSEE